VIYAKKRGAEVKQFIATTRKSITSHALWDNASEEEVLLALKQIERSILGSIHEIIFSKTLDDLYMNKYHQQMCNLKIEIDLAEFDVAPKYHSEAPWYFALAELAKINSFKAPHDKFLCISKCWEIISNYVSLLDDPGPDDCYPIMSFLIYNLADKQLLSNVHYIILYCSTMDELEEGRLIAFRTVARSVYNMLPSLVEKYSPSTVHSSSSSFTLRTKSEKRITKKSNTLVFDVSPVGGPWKKALVQKASSRELGLSSSQPTSSRSDSPVTTPPDSPRLSPRQPTKEGVELSKTRSKT